MVLAIFSVIVFQSTSEKIITKGRKVPPRMTTKGIADQPGS
jgi:hypothetical protein